MKAVAVVGPSDSGKTKLVEHLVQRLTERGTVATVKHLDHIPDIDTQGKDTARHRAAGAAVTYGISGEGWFATGDSHTLSEVLDDLALEYGYVVVEGYSELDLPAVVLGGRAHSGLELATAPTGEEIDLDAVLKQIEDTEPHVTLESLVREAKSSPDEDRAGAIATFTGRVRAKEFPEDSSTEFLEFETYEGVADQRMAEISAELEAREGVHEVLMHHRTGIIESGEDIVFVVVLAGHRKEAFRTVEDGIDRLKDEVPIFKKENTIDEEFWVHERA
ncbi:MAG TPA: molybdopterin synthase [Halococcus sp.]|nr:molybdopterin synthase [Halococcus sp.]